MTVNARLAARAEAHGLERAPNGWFRAAGLSGVVVCPPYRGSSFRGWSWSPPREDGSPWVSVDGYPDEGTALGALLDWLDLQHPERKLPAPSTGAQLAEVVGLLREAVGHLENTAPAGRSLLAHDAADKALHLLQSLALPPASDEGEVLAVAWDFALQRGGLSESGRAALVAAVRHHPEVVTAARLAVWVARGPHEEVVLFSLDANRWGERLAEAWQQDDDGAWSWVLCTDMRVQDEAPTFDAAREACARALPEWRILEAPVSPPAEAAPEPARLATACRACDGAGWQVDGAGVRVTCAECDGDGWARRTPREVARERLLTPITDEEYRRRQAAGEALTDEELAQVAASIWRPVRCSRCLDVGRVSVGNLWGPFEDCPACRRTP